MAVDVLNWFNSLQWQLDVFIHLQIVVCSSIFTCNNFAFILIQAQSLLETTGRLWKKSLFCILRLFLLKHVCYFFGKQKWNCVMSYKDSFWRWRYVQLLVNVMSVTQPLVRRWFCRPGARDFSLLQNVQPGCEAHPASWSVYTWGGICSPCVNWPGHELDHSLPYCVRLRVIGALYISTPPVCHYSLHSERIAFFLPCHSWSAILWLVACRAVIISHISGGWYNTLKPSLRDSTFGFTEFTYFFKAWNTCSVCSCLHMVQSSFWLTSCFGSTYLILNVK